MRLSGTYSTQALSCQALQWFSLTVCIFQHHDILWDEEFLAAWQMTQSPLRLETLFFTHLEYSSHGMVAMLHEPSQAPTG